MNNKNKIAGVPLNGSLVQVQGSEKLENPLVYIENDGYEEDIDSFSNLDHNGDNMLIVIRDAQTHERISMEMFDFVPEIIRLVNSTYYDWFKRGDYSSTQEENLRTAKEILSTIVSICNANHIEIEVAKKWINSELKFARFTPNGILLLGCIDSCYWEPFAAYCKIEGDEYHEIGNYGNCKVIAETLYQHPGVYIVSVIDKDNESIKSYASCLESSVKVDIYMLCEDGYWKKQWKQFFSIELEYFIRHLFDSVVNEIQNLASLYEIDTLENDLSKFCEKHGIRALFSLDPSSIEKQGQTDSHLYSFEEIPEAKNYLFLENSYVLGLSKEISGYLNDIIVARDFLFTGFSDTKEGEFHTYFCYVYVDELKAFVLTADDFYNKCFYTIEKIGCQTNRLLYEIWSFVPNELL